MCFFFLCFKDVLGKWSEEKLVEGNNEKLVMWFFLLYFGMGVCYYCKVSRSGIK